MLALLLLALHTAPAEPDPEPEPGWEAAGWGAPSEAAEPTETPPDEPVAPEPVAAAATPTAPAANPAPAAAGFEAKTKVSDVLTGSVRLTGSFLHFPDEPLLYPGGDDALALVVGRLIAEEDAGEHVHLSFNAFTELSRVPAGGSFGGSFASAGSTASAYRTRYLSWRFWDDGSVGGQLGIDRVGMQATFDPVKLDVGRLPISYSVMGLLSTNDFFAPFSATAVNRLYKPGVDALRVSFGITPDASVESLGALGYDPETDHPSWGHTAVMNRVAFAAAGFRWEVLGGKVSQRWVAGGSLQGDAGPVNLRAEFHAGFPDEDGDLPDRSDQPTYGRVAAGPSMTFAWHNAQIAAEYMFASDGATSARGYIARAQSGYTDDLPYLGRHYVGLGGGLELIPILRLGVTSLVNATDGSGLAGLSLQYNVANESDLFVGVFVPWGRGLGPVDPTTATPTLRSEFGLAPVTAYLESRVFF
jgi:hypothetical protein